MDTVTCNGLYQFFSLILAGLFFVISGYIVLSVHLQDAGSCQHQFRGLFYTTIRYLLYVGETTDCKTEPINCSQTIKDMLQCSYHPDAVIIETVEIQWNDGDGHILLT